METISADGSTVEIEIGIYANEPTGNFEGEDREYLGGVSEPSRTLRKGFNIDCYPFSTHLATNGDTIPQNSQTLISLRDLFVSKKYVWIDVPDTPRIAPPRWTDTTNFSGIEGLLPMRVVRDGGFDISLNREIGAEEVSLSLKAREL